MKKAIKLTAAALAATLSLSLAACGSSASTGTASTSASADGVVYRTLDEIKADGTINIGVFSDKNPFGYVDENGALHERCTGRCFPGLQRHHVAGQLERR